MCRDNILLINCSGGGVMPVSGPPYIRCVNCLLVGVVGGWPSTMEVMRTGGWDTQCLVTTNQDYNVTLEKYDDRVARLAL